jgi:hypothetical protein
MYGINLTNVVKHILNNKSVEGACVFCGLICDSFLEIRESSALEIKRISNQTLIVIMFIILNWV